MNPLLLPVSYDYSMIALSWIVSAIGAFTALSAISRARRADGGLDRFNVIMAGVALGGVGIWSMHFIGMLAWKVELGVGYRLFETLVSLVAAIVVSALALGYVAKGEATIKRLLIAGPLAGIGVTVMHYLGMYSMRFYGFFDWNYATVAVSAAIAMTAATVALWLAFNTRKTWHRAVAAQVMATAVCTMHYTGMSAASVMCTTANRKAVLPDLMRPSDLPGLVLTIALGVALMIASDLAIQRLSSHRPDAGGRLQGAGR
jgi:NO-binding membrane sensor protein with MHYT domain